jgi:hypothetical protein
MGEEHTVSQYVLAALPPGWLFGMPLPFSRAAHDAWRDKLEAGTRLIFFDPGREAIVGEGEVHGIFLRPHEWPSSSLDELPHSIANADYVLPVATLYQREAAALIPAGEVRRILNDDGYPHHPGEIREIDGTTYHLLTQDWP